MLLLNCAILLLCATGWIQANPELVWLEDLQNDHHLRHLEMGLPNQLEFNLKREGGNQLKLRLQENRRLNANAPMYEAVMENGKQTSRELDVPLIIGTKFYTDKQTGTAVKVSCTNQPFGACKRAIEGSLHIDGESYEIKPSLTMLTSRGIGNQEEVPHLITKVSPPPEPKLDDRVRGLYGADYKLIPEEDKDEASQHDHKSIPDESSVRGFQEHDYKPIPEELPEPNIRQELVDELRELLEEEELQDDIKDMYVKKNRMERAAGDLYAVEVVMVIDYALWKKYYAITDANNGMDKTTATEYFLKERLAHIMNGVSLRYEAIEDKAMNVYVTISEFLIYKSKTRGHPLSPSVNIPNRNGVEYADSDVYIDNLPNWAKTAPIKNNNDHIMVITGYTLYYDKNINNDGVLGVAFVRGACGSYRTSVQEDGDYFVLTSVAAHELGHNLGADHDGEDASKGCSGKIKNIMAPSITSFGPGEAYSVNPWKFSSCSIMAFKKFFGSGKCFLDHGDYYDKEGWEKHNKLQPGERIPAGEQCKLILGDSSYQCTKNERPENICRTMRCYNSRTRDCEYYAAARGTSCGNSMWCIEGRCVERTVIATTTEEPETTTTTQAPGTTTTQVPVTTTTTTTTQAPVTTTTDSTCVDSGWFTWGCEKVSRYFYDVYQYEPSVWCQYRFWARACCAFCKEPSTTTTTMAPTTTEKCVDRGYQNKNCKKLSKYFKRVYGYTPRQWCTDRFYKYRCCKYCAARGV